MPDLYGAPAGLMAAAAEKRTQQAHDLSMQKGEMELDVAKMELSRQQQMISMLQQRAAGKKSTTQGVEDLASDMDALAEMAMRSGHPEKAKDYAVAGSTLRKNQREMTSSKLESDIKEMNMMSSLLQSVEDETSWRKANAMFAMQTGRQSPWAQLPYNPELVSKLQTGVQNSKDRALTAAAKAREAASRAQVDESQTRINLIKAQTRLADARAERLKKVGATEPKPADLRIITDLLQNDYSGALLPEEARVLARPVAERMLELINRQSLSKGEAAERAYQEAKASGAFGGLLPKRQLSGSRQKPLEIPEDKAKLKPNMLYKGKGAYADKILLWTGTGFIEPKAASEDDEEFADEEEE